MVAVAEVVVVEEVVVEVVEEVVHAGAKMLGNAPLLISTLCPQIRLVGLPNEGKQRTAVI